MSNYDVIIIGAGAAGLAAAGVASRTRRVAIIDMGQTPGRKVAISGGGRCNFTNAAVAANRYFGENPDFVRGAISRTTPSDILDWAVAHKIPWTEKTPGQYFAANGASDVVNALIHDARASKFIMNTRVIGVAHSGDVFHIKTSGGEFAAESVIVATGGLSWPDATVSDIGYKIAKSFGHKIIPVRPALCAIATDVFNGAPAGISMDTEITIGREKIRDSMLVTHFGIGGPAVYRASVHNISEIHVNIMPGVDAYEYLRAAKRTDGRRSVANLLGAHLPIRIARWVCDDVRNIADRKDSDLRHIADKINNIVIPRDNIKLHSMHSAEVVRGGVDTHDVSSKTMESKLRPGLFFAGEVLDIAGDLGGFNLHWAWASGRIAGANA